MPSVNNSGEPLSLLGPLHVILLPECLGFSDPRELGRALLEHRYGLSHQDVHLLEQIAAGSTSKEITQQLDLAEEKTVKRRIQRLYLKLAVSGRAQAAVIAAQFGLVTAKVPAQRPE
jgi:ATP/maltotriose-dependent transcriptional regulator MalT